MRRALEGFGVMFIAESDSIGAGVRLKFLRRDVKQIDRLENEGGIVGRTTSRKSVRQSESTCFCEGTFEMFGV